jgi:hypothetical protein
MWPHREGIPPLNTQSGWLVEEAVFRRVLTCVKSTRGDLRVHVGWTGHRRLHFSFPHSLWGTGLAEGSATDGAF